MYIFLDVDGVLNTEEDWKRRKYSLNNACVIPYLISTLLFAGLESSQNSYPRKSNEHFPAKILRREMY